MTVKIDGTNTEANPAFTGADTDTGLQCGTNELKLVTGGTARATVDSSGNLGVGTTTPSQSWTGGSSRTQQLSGLSGQITVFRVNEAGGTGGDLQLVSSTSAEAAVYNFANGSLRFGTNGTERMRILSSGGLTFNGDTAAANALDDYEEGLFVPTITGQTQGTATLDGNVNSLAYTKIGRVVHITGRVRVTSVSSVSGNLRFGNLPFPNVSNLTDHADYGALTIFGYKLDLPSDAAGPTFIELGPGTSQGTMLYVRDNSNWPSLPENSLDSGDTYLHVQGRYLVDA